MTANGAIRRARPDEAAALSSIARRAKEYWGYPPEWLAAWRDALTVDATFVDAHPVFVVVGPGDAPVGWYALVGQSTARGLDHLWVAPEVIGKGIGRRLLAHACATAAAHGAEHLRIESAPYAVPFYQHMGAHLVEHVQADVCGTRRVLPVLRLGVAQPDEPGAV